MRVTGLGRPPSFYLCAHRPTVVEQELCTAGGRAEARPPTSARLMLFVDDYRGDDNWKEHDLSNGAAYPILQQARNDFKASDTSTGITIPWRGAIVTGDDRYQDLRGVEGVTIRLGTLV